MPTFVKKNLLKQNKIAKVIKVRLHAISNTEFSHIFTIYMSIVQ